MELLKIVAAAIVLVLLAYGVSLHVVTYWLYGDCGPLNRHASACGFSPFSMEERPRTTLEYVPSSAVSICNGPDGKSWVEPGDTCHAQVSERKPIVVWSDTLK